MLDVINAQGAQVVQLQGRVNQLETIVFLLADGAKQTRFTPDEITAITERIENVTWDKSKTGYVTIKIKKAK